MKIKKIILLFVFCILIVNGFCQSFISGKEIDNLSDRAYLNNYFLEASLTYNIPVEILQAIAFVESHWFQNIPVVNGDTPPSYGVMGLRDDNYFGHSLQKAAEIMGLPASGLKANARNNILGVAALLNNYKQQQKGVNFERPEDWQDVIQKYSGIPQPQIARLYSHDVYKIFSQGFNSYGVYIRKVSIDSSLLADPLLNCDNQNKDILQIGYPVAIWTPAATGNYAVANRPTSNAINKIIIHDTEGSFASAVSWFQNAASGVSAHYIVRSSDGYVVQMVDDKDIGYHAGNFSYNQTSIGIEMEGYVSDPSYFSAAAYNSVKNLCIWECNQWGIAPNRTAIIGHNQIPDPGDATLWGGAGHHTDPGGAWDWDTFIQSVSGVSSVYQPLLINTASLNVRTGPGATNPLLTTVSANQEYVSYYTDPVSGWRLIFIPGGNSLHYDGWISNAYVLTDNCAAQVKVSGAWPSTLKIRSGPSTTYGIIDQVTDNQIFVASVISAGWYNYHTPAATNALNGWSSGSYLQLYDPCNIITGIDHDTEKDAEFTIYPNPASDKIFVELPDGMTLSSVSVYNSAGSLLLQQTFIEAASGIDISALAKGLYFMKLANTDRIITVKFVKE